MDIELFPPSDSPNLKTNEVIYSIIDFSPTGLSYIDLTGQFPYKSTRGNGYIIVGYYYGTNTILGTLLKITKQLLSQAHGSNSIHNSNIQRLNQLHILLITKYIGI